MGKFSFLKFLYVVIICFLVHPLIIFSEENKNIPVVNNIIVMFHDTTVSNGLSKRIADRDSVMKYLPALITNYDVIYFNQTTVLPSLSQYNTMIVVETSYDNSGALCLGADSRSAIKNWLNTGTPGNKKMLISIGGDQGYNYDRNASPNADTSFTRSYFGFIYLVDKAVLSPGTITGVVTDIANSRPIVSPSDAGFYPDGCSLTNGGIPVYKYNGHTSNDTLGGISKVTTKFITVTSFQDPRYFTGGNIKPWLRALIAYVRSWGPDGISAVHGTPNKFSLSQNYPNPFNPATTIKFSIPKNNFVSLKVYDITGKEAAVLINEEVKSGEHTVDFNGLFLQSGVYFYVLNSGDFKETKKMIIMK